MQYAQLKKTHSLHFIAAALWTHYEEAGAVAVTQRHWWCLYHVRDLNLWQAPGHISGTSGDGVNGSLCLCGVGDGVMWGFVTDS